VRGGFEFEISPGNAPPWFRKHRAEEQELCRREESDAGHTSRRPRALPNARDALLFPATVPSGA
jgi:hypothetical protein